MPDANDFPVWWPAKDGPQADWNMLVLLQTIHAQGIDALWESCSPCPCGTVSGNSPGRGCLVCDGTGWEFHSQQTIKAVVVGASREWNPLVRDLPLEPGQAMFTVRAEHAPAFNDRLTLQDARLLFHELRVREAPLADVEADPVPATVERLRYPIKAQTVVTSRSDNTTPIASYTMDVLHLRRSANGLGGPALVKGVDYTVTDDGGIDWSKGDVLGTSPAVGTLFSVAYKTWPIFRVMGLPHASRNATIRAKGTGPRHEHLPVQFLARLEQYPEG